MDIAKMTARRPYMLRAFYDWLVDNDLTPHLVVDATMPGVRVPVEFIQDGQIILNIAPRAVGNLELGNDAITFHARFSGRPHSVIVPVYAVQAIYARENGAGTMFEPEEAYTNIEEETMEEEQSPSFTTVSDDAQVADSESGDSESEAPRPKGKPSLRVIK
ncbi:MULTISPECIES: ClpXP protease specificity-enhancing factor [Vibrio]|jgi:stringent starvation protein B|uniref:ClpXP protease specificity-enhancing factor n=1 Tax=Vibrio natriegens NBRC 15636 = ATCC 14048 = DSM 759 TaxID=1219067 RepID=A0AAN1CV04_VIBNA|nr:MULTISPECIES: ClpXP protease specificity-enhancing factor [Vibrio]WMN87681.1 ClpXP protease specificity-enhancing factor [Vibrio parahaemolyticus]ALR16516.1 peptidase [Vibrio natriegens NBRC 15636 = ATCC 14048 = DSM 759]ANQ11618.1 ClpXP protease specificity-enhancing factor [Vibrio natriegens NBRC 15636 = ATCC 14048 = DSM 759]ANQ25400.1 ClpXP protease specificity-enhancing factor [Vibrio natriegens]AXT69888.1 ClpXP protease specificity-enhancing factor [Vibrio sp. dhg]